MMPAALDRLVTAHKALGHPARLRLLAMLRSGELCVCQVTEVLGLAPSTVSAHLRELKLAGLVTERKEGRWVYVGLSDDPLARDLVETTISAVGADPRLEEDALLVEELRRLPVEDLCRLGYQEAARRHGLAPLNRPTGRRRSCP